MEATSRNASEIGDEHRHHGAALDVSHTDPSFDQGVLEGETAAQQEGNQVDEVLPQIGLWACLQPTGRVAEGAAREDTD